MLGLKLLKGEFEFLTGAYLLNIAITELLFFFL